jgi:hypothetical protein
MGFDVCDVVVATVTRVGSMNGLGKLPFVDYCVATQAFRVVNTLIAKFPTLNDELFPFFGGLGRFGHHSEVSTSLF